jgi:phosphoglycolate phosphatase-like HAD superfamily hydrolase
MYASLAALQAAPEEAVMIGDAVSDIECAQRAGVTAIAVTWGIKPERIRMLSRPEYMVDNWPQLANLLASLAQDWIEEAQAAGPERAEETCLPEMKP